MDAVELSRALAALLVVQAAHAELFRFVEPGAILGHVICANLVELVVIDVHLVLQNCGTSRRQGDGAERNVLRYARANQTLAVIVALSLWLTLDRLLPAAKPHRGLPNYR